MRLATNCQAPAVQVVCHHLRFVYKMAVTALTHSWNILRGCLDNKYSDLTLMTEQKESINCHKVVLAAVSNKVKTALSKKDCDVIEIRNVKYGGLKNVIQFVYDGRVEIPNFEEFV